MDNWYKHAQNMQDIERIALEVRQSFLTNDDDTLKAMCLPVSRELKKRLIAAGFDTAIVVQGVFQIDEPDPSAYENWDINDFLPAEQMETEEEEMAYAEEEMESAKYTPLHYWVEVKNLIIDVTADQFNDELIGEEMPPIIIQSKSDSDRYTTTVEDWI